MNSFNIEAIRSKWHIKIEKMKNPSKFSSNTIIEENIASTDERDKRANNLQLPGEETEWADYCLLARSY